MNNVKMCKDEIGFVGKSCKNSILNWIEVQESAQMKLTDQKWEKNYRSPQLSWQHMDCSSDYSSMTLNEPVKENQLLLDM